MNTPIKITDIKVINEKKKTIALKMLLYRSTLCFFIASPLVHVVLINQYPVMNWLMALLFSSANPTPLILDNSFPIYLTF
jgi:hypothetical protein